jgi:PIF1-like helicase/Helix-turn-helix domain
MRDKLNGDPWQLALEFSCFTGRSLFVTGRAGTGKTTFLSTVREQCRKKMLVLAPTGVAAVNAAGLTIHSFFQFSSDILDEHFFDKSFPVYNAEKRRVIQELELLVIDEVSMVRADVIDAIDRVLRHYRNKTSVPFGGVQLLLVGDLFQLSPVLDDQASDRLEKLYSSPFFFEARSIRELNYLVIELISVFRQADGRFIALLNAIRNSTCSDQELQVLNERCISNHLPSKDCVFLTTHRITAEAFNKKALDQIGSPTVLKEAIIEGEFPHGSDPAPRRLELKIGARVIFTKNDTAEKKEYFNGKAGVIEQIAEDKLVIRVSTGPNIELERSAWINRGARYNSSKGEFEWLELGTFRQFPVLLAWAVTIHKSQGMTFDKAVIDAGNAFAPGQVYVALSRLRTLDGLFLKEPLTRAAILTDPRIVAFYKQADHQQATDNDLARGKVAFRHELLIRLFQFERCEESILTFVGSHSGTEIAAAWEQAISSLKEVSSRFERQLWELLARVGDDKYRTVYARVEQAVQYFSEQLFTQLADPLYTFAGTLKNTKKNEPLVAELNRLFNVLEEKKREWQTGLQVADGLMKGTDTAGLVDMISRQDDGFSPATLAIKQKEPKGNSQTTQQKTLALFKKGLGLEEIAQKRNLAQGLVEDHLNSFLKTGEVRLDQLVTPEKVDRITALRRQNPGWSVHELRLVLGSDVSFGEIRAVLRAL